MIAIGNNTTSFFGKILRRRQVAACRFWFSFKMTLFARACWVKFNLASIFIIFSSSACRQPIVEFFRSGTLQYQFYVIPLVIFLCIFMFWFSLQVDCYLFPILYFQFLKTYSICFFNFSGVPNLHPNTLGKSFFYGIRAHSISITRDAAIQFFWHPDMSHLY